MKNAERVAKGLLIFTKYDENADCFAERDIIYAGPSKRDGYAISDEDSLELRKLGWKYDRENDSWGKDV